MLVEKLFVLPPFFLIRFGVFKCSPVKKSFEEQQPHLTLSYQSWLHQQAIVAKWSLPASRQPPKHSKPTERKYSGPFSIACKDAQCMIATPSIKSLLDAYACLIAFCIIGAADPWWQGLLSTYPSRTKCTMSLSPPVPSQAVELGSDCHLISLRETRWCSSPCEVTYSLRAFILGPAVWFCWP